MFEALRKVLGREVAIQVSYYRTIISSLFRKCSDEVVTFPPCKVVIKSVTSTYKELCVGLACSKPVIEWLRPCVLLMLLLSVSVLLLLLHYYYSYY